LTKNIKHPLRGNIFETFAVAELMKSFLNRGERPGLHFWRDSNGVEVDVLIEHGGRIIPVEIKSGKTVTGNFFTGLERWSALAGSAAINPTLIYGGAENYLHKGVRVIGWREAGSPFWAEKRKGSKAKKI
jgi:hypothetical protein